MYSLCNLIKNPTCHKAATSTLLDVVLVSNRAKYLGVLNCVCEMSDFHNFVGASTRKFAPRQQPKHIFYRSYKNFVETNYKNDITSAPFHVCEVFDDVEDMVWFTNELLSDIVNHHAPVKRKLIKRESVPIWTPNLERLFIRETWSVINTRNTASNTGMKIAVCAIKLSRWGKSLSQLTLRKTAPVTIENSGGLFHRSWRIKQAGMGAI